jgi:hypothetical protein
MVLCSARKGNQHSGGTFQFHLWGLKSNQEVCTKMCSLLNHDDRGDLLLQNVCWLSPEYMVPYPRRLNSPTYFYLFTPRCCYAQFYLAVHVMCYISSRGCVHSVELLCPILRMAHCHSVLLCLPKVVMRNE